MKTVQLNVEPRTETGSGPAHRLRESGRIPACIYGKDKAINISIDAREFRVLQEGVRGTATFVEIAGAGDETLLTLIQDVQRNSLKDRVDHVDFHEIERGHTFVTHVPVVLVNESGCAGVKQDAGVLDFSTHQVEIRTRPSKMPEHIEVDVAELRIGESIHLRDLPELDEVTYLGDGDIPIVTITGSSSAAATVTETEEAVAEEAVAGETAEA